MAVTIHLPQVHRPNIKRLATAGVAVLAAAVAVTGYQAVTNNTTNSVSPASSGIAFTELAEVNTIGVPQVRPGTNAANPAAAASVGSASIVSSTGAVDTSALADWTRANGMAGSSPTSVGATAGAAVAPTSPTHVGGHDMSFAGVYASPATSAAAATTPTGGFASLGEFLDANIDTQVAAAIAPDYQIGALTRLFTALVPEATSEAVQTGGFASRAEFVEANVVPTSPAPAVAADSQIAQLEALRPTTTSEFNPYPEAPSVPDVQPRSNFASDIEWIEANGFG